MMLDSKVSRRRFLKYTGAGLLATVGSGVLKLTMGEAASQSVWSHTADVIVIGTGAAGAAAAIEAARGGASVLLLERMGNFGGSSRNSGGTIYLGGGTAIQKATGFDDTPELMYEYMMAALGHGGNPDLLRAYADGSVDLFNWLVDLGVPFKASFVPGKVLLIPGDDGLQFSGNELNYPYREITPPMARGHKVQAPGSSGHVLMSVLQNNVNDLGVDVRFNTMAQRLVVSEDRVVGLEVEMNGETHLLRANKGIVLATGGFQFNKEMVAFHANEYVDINPLGMPGEDGSGIKMAQALGAETVNMAFASPWSFIYPPDAMLKSVLVSPMGLRFINEDRYGADVADATARDHGGQAYVILDQKILNELGNHADTLHFIAQSETLEGLAGQLNMPAEVLENTMSFYNQGARDGRDILYGKVSDYVQPVETPPYYAVDWATAIRSNFITLGGLRIDESGRVKDVFGSTIEGLYAAGRTTNGISARYYNSGTSLGDCLFFGRASGRHAARARGWM